MMFCSIPAVNHHRPCVGRGGGLDPADEGQQPGGVVGNPVLRPGREVELAHLMLRRVASLLVTTDTDNTQNRKG